MNESFELDDNDLIKFLENDTSFNQSTGTIQKEFKSYLSQYGTIKKISQTRTEKILTIKSLYIDQDTDLEVEVSGKWFEIEFEIDDTVYLSSYFDEFKKRYVVNDTATQILLENYIIIEPEFMLGGTMIKYAFPCHRRAVINELFKVVNKQNKITVELLIGLIVHEIFELALLGGINNLEKSKEIIDESLRKYNLDVGLLEVSKEEIKEQINEFVKNVMKFFSTYVVKREKIENVKIKRVIEKEKMIQSQTLGIKGIMDILVEGEYDDNMVIPVPLELKTGKDQRQKDIIQVLIYCLLLCNQLSKTNYSGILIYLKSFKIYNIKMARNDIMTVLMIRNKLAKFMKRIYSSYNNEFQLPQKIDNKNECDFCFVRDTCFFHETVYQNTIISLKDVDFELMNKSKIRINDKIREYYEYFIDLINKENNHSIIEQQKLISLKYCDIDTNEYSNYQISSIKIKQNSIELTLFNHEEFTEVEWYQESISDYYLLYDSKEKVLLKGILLGKNLENSKELLTIEIIKKDNHIAGFFEGKKEILLKSMYSNTYTSKLQRGNLVSFLLYGNERLKKLIIDLDQPKFEDDQKYKTEIIQFISKDFSYEFKSMNSVQQVSIIKSLLCKDYALIMGFPGSGKTTVISMIIDILTRRKKKILVTALTNTAVDNILIKLKKRNLNFLRISNNPNSVHPEIRENILSNETFKNIEDSKKILDSTYIFGSTVCGINHKIFGYLDFEYCIVDEACQIIEPFMLGPLMLSSKFILVGDPFQLTAIVKNDTQSPISLFERLYSKYPESGVQLHEQYRMNEDILSLSNACVYDKNMKCANSAISKQKLNLDYKKLKEICQSEWILNALDPDKAVVFLDYSKYARESKIDLDFVRDSNKIEAEIIYKLIHFLENIRYDFDNCSVITPYKNQESLLKKSLTKFKFDDKAITIDKSQGLERELIIISFVKTNKKTKILKDIQRINVAFTRSRAKLIVIGIMDYLENVDKLKGYMDLIQERKWVYNITKI